MTELERLNDRVLELESLYSIALEDMVELNKRIRDVGAVRELQLANDAIRYRLALEAISSGSCSDPSAVAKAAITGDLW